MSGILGEPAQPDWQRTCWHCGEKRALELLRREQSERSGRIDVYRCKHCGREQSFAERHPPHAV